MIIYKITNLINKKVYIGKTIKSLEFRWKQHLKHAKNKVNRYLYDAINCYGSDNFKIEEIDKCGDEKTLNKKEINWISFYNSMSKSKGYNMQKGGIGGAQPLEVRMRAGKKIALKNKGSHRSKSAKKNMSIAQKALNKHLSTELKLRIF